jgi:hypothetical protein
MTTLLFDLADTIVIAEHALNAELSIPTFYERDRGEQGSPALEWAKDDGTYLMSNGAPSLPGRNGEPNMIVYARGWGSGTRPEFGGEHDGDDFVELIPVDAGLLDSMRDAHLDGYRWFALEVQPDSFRIRLRR